MAVAEDDADIFCVTSGGYGKRTPASSYPTQKRGGQGVITIKDSLDRGDLVGVTSVRDNHELMIISQDGTVIRVPVVSVRTTGRNTMGVRVMNLRGADKVSSMARVVTSSDGNGNGRGANGYGAPDEYRREGDLDLEESEDSDEDLDEGLEEDLDDSDDVGADDDL
jgi:DNA gyrase subunit A